MTAEHQIILYLPLAVIFGVFFLTTFTGRGGRGIRDRSFLFLLCIFVWQCMELLYLFMRDTGYAHIFYPLKYIPLEFAPIALLHHVVSFYRIKRQFPHWIYYSLMAVPVVTSVLGVIPATSRYFVSYGETGHGFGFIYYIGLASLYVTIICISVIIVLMCLRLPGAYRRGSVFHIAIIVVIAATQIMFQLSDFDIDFQYFGFSLAGVLFYCAHLIHSDTSSLSIDRSSVFDFLDQAIFILNEDGIIVEVNDPAIRFLKSLSRSVEHVAFDGLLSVLSNNNRIIVKKLEDSEDSDIHVIGSAIPLIYRMERRHFTMSDGIGQGEFVTLTDVTRNRLIIDRLRDMAGVDGLTGVANRYRYQDLLRKLDSAGNYPLAVVIGDVNGLKTINDNLGHQMGDQYLKDIAAALSECCPRGGHVARYGGDEFATLLTSTSVDAVEAYIGDVGKALSALRGDSPYTPSIALGYAIKHHGNENLNTLIGQADQKMYADKMARKSAEREALNNG